LAFAQDRSTLSRERGSPRRQGLRYEASRGLALNAAAEEITLEAASKCCAVEIRVTEMTGRQQRALEYTYWRYNFDKCKEGVGMKREEYREYLRAQGVPDDAIEKQMVIIDNNTED
jgi:hypothetical protein